MKNLTVLGLRAFLLKHRVTLSDCRQAIGAEIAYCARCDEPFVKIHGNSHYCPGIDGKESKCAAATRQETYRHKLKEAEA